MNINENLKNVDITGSVSLVQRLLTSLLSAPYRTLGELPKKIMLLRKQQICKIVLVSAIVGLVNFVLVMLIQTYFVRFDLLLGEFPGVLMLICIMILLALYLFLQQSSLLDTLGIEKRDVYQYTAEEEYYEQPSHKQDETQGYSTVTLEEDTVDNYTEDILTPLSVDDLDLEAGESLEPNIVTLEPEADTLESLADVLMPISDNTATKPDDLDIEIDTLDLEAIAASNEPFSLEDLQAEDAENMTALLNDTEFLESDLPIWSVDQKDIAPLMGAVRQPSAYDSVIEDASSNAGDAACDYILPAQMLNSILGNEFAQKAQEANPEQTDSLRIDEYMADFCRSV